MTHFKKNIIFVCQNRVLRARLLSWREFIDKLKFTDNLDWLTVLKVSLEIFNGEIKGFAMLPDAKDRRQAQLKDYMKQLIFSTIETVIFKFKSKPDDSDNSQRETDDSSEDKKFQIEEIAIKASIEFCLSIGETGFLFGDIFQFFQGKGLESKFISLLCPPIIAGQFRKEKIPEDIFIELFRMYERKKEFKVLEKIVQQVDL